MCISRFGIPLGFGDDSVDVVCRKWDVDSPTFLAVANFLSNRPYNVSGISLEALILYLKSAHAYFIDFLLPGIREKLVKAIGDQKNDEVARLLITFFDDYVTEIREHMEYENNTVFNYIQSLIEKNNQPITIPSGLFSDRHDDVARKLNELKDIIVRYYPRGDANLMNSVLFDIISCEKDILNHCAVEDNLFEPAVRELEKELVNNVDATRDQNKNSRSVNTIVGSLSDREKEIIRLVACGLSNKEIADTLFLSVHTVTTHRRNLSAKLDIHSPAALTLFAIINHLVDLNEIKSFISPK